MARVTGLEPATSGVTGRHSNQLSYTRVARSDVRRGEGRRLGGGDRMVKPVDATFSRPLFHVGMSAERPISANYSQEKAF